MKVPVPKVCEGVRSMWALHVSDRDVRSEPVATAHVSRLRHELDRLRSEHGATTVYVSGMQSHIVTVVAP